MFYKMFVLKPKYFMAIYLFIILSLIFLILPSSVLANIIIDSRAAKPGETVTFSVMIDPGPNDIEAFGFELRFNNKVLEYKGYSPASMTNRFDFFPGRKRLLAGLSHNLGVQKLCHCRPPP